MFGVNSSPFLLNATLQHHISQYSSDPEFVVNLLNSFYVDDLVSGEGDLVKCLSLYQKSMKCLSEGGFNLRKWISNSPKLLDLIREDRTKAEGDSSEQRSVAEDTETYARTTAGHLEELDMKNEHKVLGLNWNCVSDEFIFKFEALLKLAEGLEPTRRNLLKVTSSFFDPLGILSSVLVQMKLLFRELCQEKVAWDAPLPEPVRRKWIAWLQDLREVRQIIVPRCVYDGLVGAVTSYTLHGFGDALARAYCAVVYLLLKTSSGSYPVLLTSKTRVAPLTKQSIPRLELLSGVILALTEASMWNHCPGIENPADIGSRGVFASKLRNSTLWWRGASWLSEPVSSWPKSEVCHQSLTEECITEQKKSLAGKVVSETVLLVASQPDLDACIPISNFSCCDKLFRVTALVHRFVRNLKIKAKILKEGTVCHEEVTEAEIAHSEVLWLRSVQRNLKSLTNYSHLEHEFGLYEDENRVSRCKGRIANADLPHETRFPALLPRNHHISTLLVRQAHEKVHHSKVVATLSQLRSRFWIIKGRQFVKKIISRCTVCRRYEGRGYKVPPQNDLPGFRLSQKPAFTCVGVD